MTRAVRWQAGPVALYNRHRPRTFAEVIGQEHVTDALRQALRTGHVHHAYLFSGPRGCGKTSSARILAASLNCVQGPTPDPCGECEHCVSIRLGSSLDVIEIDAASHGGVEDARDLRERAYFAPASARCKVYVVDEAHMVTREGFNALLKVVEEPPPYLKFVFATTEPDKVISTIRSRTHHYPFRLVAPGVLRRHLETVCVREGVDVDPAVLPLVVRAGAGSVRDALSVLDQLIAGAGGERVSYERAAALLGVTDAALLDEAVDALAARDGAALFAMAGRVIEAGHDSRRFLADLLARLRDLIIIDAVPDAEERGLLETYAPDQLDRMRGQASRLGPAELSRAADVMHAGLVEMRGTASPRLLLELVLARVLLPEAGRDPSAVLVRVERLERRFGLVAAGVAEAHDRPGPRAPQPETPGVGAVSAPVPAAHGEPAGPNAAPPALVAPPPAGSARAAPPPLPPARGAPATAAGGDVDAAGLRQVWDQVLAAVRGRKRTTEALLAHAQVTDVRGSDVALRFSTSHIARLFATGVNPDVLAEALREVLGGQWRVVVEGGDDPGGGQADRGGNRSPGNRGAVRGRAGPAGPGSRASGRRAAGGAQAAHGGGREAQEGGRGTQEVGPEAQEDGWPSPGLPAPAEPHDGGPGDGGPGDGGPFDESFDGPTDADPRGPGLAGHADPHTQAMSLLRQGLGARVLQDSGGDLSPS
ncbi:MAG: DNA polymerase III subunit gamma and tau [Frankiaceae bacterium]